MFPIVCQRRDSFKLFLGSLTGDERCQLLQMRNRYGQTILHFAAAETDSETVGMILNSVSEVESYSLLSVRGNDKSTPIHYAYFHVNLGNNKILATMKSFTSKEAWYKLIQIPDNQEQTLLQVSLWHGHKVAAEIIVASVAANYFLHFLTTTDGTGRTRLQQAKDSGDQSVVALLQDYQTKALIDIALQQTNEAGMVYS